jgi:SAM-dependent methyltransferase
VSITADTDYCNLEVMSLATQYNAFLFEAVRSTAGSAKRILDFGAGGGLLAAKLRDAGYDVVCIETEHRLRSELTSAGFEAHADLEPIEDASLDFVYSLNVLEHIADDRCAVTSLARVLKPGGALFIYVPAFMVLYTSMDRQVGHLRRYRANGLRSVVEQSGLRVERIEHVDSLGFLVTLLYRLMGRADGSINDRALQFYDSVVFPISRALDRLARQIVGKNLLVIAKKPAAVAQGCHVASAP